jgi:hypothetical protein
MSTLVYVVMLGDSVYGTFATEIDANTCAHHCIDEMRKRGEAFADRLRAEGHAASYELLVAGSPTTPLTYSVASQWTDDGAHEREQLRPKTVAVMSHPLLTTFDPAAAPAVPMLGYPSQWDENLVATRW